MIDDIIKIDGKRNLVTYVEEDSGYWYAERYEPETRKHWATDQSYTTQRELLGAINRQAINWVNL